MKPPAADRRAGDRHQPSPAQSPVHRAGDVPRRSGRAPAAVSTPSPEANNNGAIAVLSDTPIAEALRQAREKAGLSVSMMARSAQTSRAAIHAYETGTREPNVTTALRLLRSCGYTMEVIPDRRYPAATRADCKACPRTPGERAPGAP
jgi:DNA-binding XRE family transcriptional regulator